jgi:hypothetical protein
MVDQTLLTAGALPETKEMVALMDQAALLEKALFVAGRFQLVDCVGPLLDRVRRSLRGLDNAGIYASSGLLRQSIATLTDLRLGDELDSLLGEVAALVLAEKSVEQVDNTTAEQLAQLHVLLCLTEGWYSFGWDRLAQPVIDRVRFLLVENRLRPREQTQLACTYAVAVGKAPPAIARSRLEEIFRHLKGLKDTHTMSSHFAVSQLDVVESVVLAVMDRAAADRQWN